MFRILRFCERAPCLERPRVLEKLQLENPRHQGEAEIAAINLNDGRPPDVRAEKRWQRLSLPD
jgi:hypothetical protein